MNIDILIAGDDATRAEMKRASECIMEINRLLHDLGPTAHAMIYTILIATWACGFDGQKNQHEALERFCRRLAQLGSAMIDAENEEPRPLH